MHAIMVAVFNSKRGEDPNFGKAQDQHAFFKMAEDLCKFSLSELECFPALMLTKQLMHKNFLPQQYQDAIVQGLESYVVNLKEKLSEDEKRLLT
mmetsp:Transcript_23453/g.23102  ORF Transcript_23453/g.23102 Transcript_23453/m.23102 type:complete len:94 (-) Transcript_23453:327-608(-)